MCPPKKACLPDDICSLLFPCVYISIIISFPPGLLVWNKVSYSLWRAKFATVPLKQPMSASAIVEMASVNLNVITV